MKNFNRIVISTLAAAAIATSAVIPAAAAHETSAVTKSRSEKHTQILIQLQDQFGSRSWLWNLICGNKPGGSAPDTSPEEKPEQPDQTPDAPAPELPENSIPDDKPEVDSPSSAVHAYEKQVVDLVNAQRAKNGLSPLALSEDLCVKARIKSNDMATNNYFSHNSPTYGSPFDMMKALGVSYRSAGENIAMGYATPEAVVTAWMNSQGHRENILSTKYTSIGVGYIADGGYWTQWFIG